ncbi:MAG: hypothetical protein QNJ46_05935 [Leptolyngbyaceae cyanobacterium MO_188.B28]|nr:hypothetical protein [Leptolyngbyaceae cyanobacterium MO_188.B28]
MLTRISVATLNAAHIPTIWPFYKNPRGVREPAKALAVRIAQIEPDIIHLQEVWSDKARDIYRKILPQYRFVHHGSTPIIGRGLMTGWRNDRFRLIKSKSWGWNIRPQLRNGLAQIVLVHRAQDDEFIELWNCHAPPHNDRDRARGIARMQAIFRKRHYKRAYITVLAGDLSLRNPKVDTDRDGVKDLQELENTFRVRKSDYDGPWNYILVSKFFPQVGASNVFGRPQGQQNTYPLTKEWAQLTDHPMIYARFEQ